MLFTSRISNRQIIHYYKPGRHKHNRLNKTGLILFFLYLSVQFYSQRTLNDNIITCRNRITKTAMITLGSWAPVNISAGFIISGQTLNKAKYFWRMNSFWNQVYGELAVNAQRSIDKLYTFHLGLDLAYSMLMSGDRFNRNFEFYDVETHGITN